jgi:hypothetical protein
VSIRELWVNGVENNAKGLMLGQGLLVGVVLTIGMVTKGCRTVVPPNA